jgi:hypothetical protein
MWHNFSFLRQERSERTSPIMERNERPPLWNPAEQKNNLYPVKSSKLAI